MKRNAKNKFAIFVFSMVIALCAVFSCGIIFASKGNANASGGIYVENGADVEINGGVMQYNDKAIVIEGGEHVIENMVISGSTNGAIHLAGGGTLTVKNCVIKNNTNWTCKLW